MRALEAANTSMNSKINFKAGYLVYFQKYHLVEKIEMTEISHARVLSA